MLKRRRSTPRSTHAKRRKPCAVIRWDKDSPKRIDRCVKQIIAEMRAKREATGVSR